MANTLTDVVKKIDEEAKSIDEQAINAVPANSPQQQERSKANPWTEAIWVGVGILFLCCLEQAFLYWSTSFSGVAGGLASSARTFTITAREFLGWYITGKTIIHTSNIFNITNSNVYTIPK